MTDQNLTKVNSSTAHWTEFLPTDSPSIVFGVKTPLPPGNYSLPFGKDRWNNRWEYDLKTGQSSVKFTISVHSNLELVSGGVSLNPPDVDVSGFGFKIDKNVYPGFVMGGGYNPLSNKADARIGLGSSKKNAYVQFDVGDSIKFNYQNSVALAHANNQIAEHLGNNLKEFFGELFWQKKRRPR